jgi:hemoglobin-like flavoprotein
MTHHQINLIKSSWRLVEAMEPEAVGSVFYNYLFDIAPEVKPMFRNPIPEQSKKLMETLSYLIARLDRLDDIIDEVVKLSRRHVGYGVREEHYVVVGAALLLTLEKGLGDGWNDELKHAWGDCYSILSSAMIVASQCVTLDAA